MNFASPRKRKPFCHTSGKPKLFFQVKIVQSSKFVPYMEVFLVDCSNQNKQGRLLKFPRHIVSLSREFVPHD